MFDEFLNAVVLMLMGAFLLFLAEKLGFVAKIKRAWNWWMNR